MEPFYDDGTVRIHHGDARELLPGLRADVIVADPPYGLAFMGKAWDQVDQQFHQAWAEAAFQALPPGGWLLAFGGTRTWHRLACGIEDAGFEIRDTLMWLYGQGFPKGKACLKPGWEPILLARKPGSSVLQIDATRIEGVVQAGAGTLHTFHGGEDGYQLGTGRRYQSSGRWPANVVLVHAPGCVPVGVRKVRGSGSVTGEEPSNPMAMLGDFSPRQPFEAYADPDGTETITAWECEPECPVFLLDQQSGERPTGKLTRKQPAVGWNGHKEWRDCDYGGDRGGASRFFYTAKASRSERLTIDGEQHPTVKPLALMRWLVRLVTPPGGTVLDPFCGSGSTLVAARMEGFRAIGVEADERWCRGSAQRVAQVPPVQEQLAL